MNFQETTKGVYSNLDVGKPHKVNLFCDCDDCEGFYHKEIKARQKQEDENDQRREEEEHMADWRKWDADRSNAPSEGRYSND